VKRIVVVVALVAAAGASAVAAPSAEIGIREGGETAHKLHTTVDATFTYGIGGYGALGVQLHGLEQLSAWNTRLATGSFDFGLVLGFQDEPQALQYGTLAGQTNDAQRLNLWVTVGHTFHMGDRRRVGLGFHLFNGWTHEWSQAALNDPKHMINAKVSDNYGLFNTGGMLKFDYRFSNYVGLSIQAVAPWPVTPSYVTTLFHVGIGLTGYFH
jgi:hypothetical protein